LCATKFLSILVSQIAAEVKDLLAKLVILEVGAAASGMNESSGRKHSFFEVNKTDPPGTPIDVLTTMAAPRLFARRSLRAVDPWETAVGQACVRDLFHSYSIRNALGTFSQCLKQRFRTFVGSARDVKPERHVAIRKRIRKTFPETQLTTANLLAAAAAFRTAACGCFDHVGHSKSISPESFD
jgi:hypothetical protein